MGRRPRLEVEGGLYHVYNRVASGEEIFGDMDDAAEFVEGVREIKKRDGWGVLAWCLMSNHYHLVIRTSAVPLWRGMHGLQNGFSRRFNRRNGRTGGLWQSRYKAKYVADERYLGRLIVYVHLNPVRAGIVEDPAEHRFGGHRELVRRVSRPLIDRDETLLCFGPSRKTALQAYLGAIRAGMEEEVDEVMTRWQPFGSGGDEELVLDPNVVRFDALGRSTGLERPALDPERFVEMVCRLMEIDPGRLASRVRDRETAGMRRLIVTLGVERWRQRGSELAKVLKKNPDVVSWWVGEGARRRLEDDEFARELERLDLRLAKEVERHGGDGLPDGE